MFPNRFEGNARHKSYDENIEERKVLTLKIVKIPEVLETTIVIELKNRTMQI